MKKLLIGCLILTLIIGCVAAQEKTGLDKLIDSINKNTAQQKKANKVIEDLEPHLEEKFDRWSKQNVSGVSLFILAIIFVHIMWTTVMSLRRKITLEKHLAKIETRLKNQDEQLLKDYKRNKEALQTQYKILTQHNQQMKEILGTTPDKKIIILQQIKLIAVGTIVGIILGVLI